MYSPPPRRPDTGAANSCKREASPSEAHRLFSAEVLPSDFLQETSTNQGLTEVNGTPFVRVDLHKESLTHRVQIPFQPILRKIQSYVS